MAETKKNDTNVVINGVLCFMSTARHVMKRDDIIRTCLVFYESDDIISAKDTLYSIVGEKPKRRRNENRIMHELQDISDLIKKCDDEGVDLPTFVADTYNSMPPSSGFEVVAQSMQTLIKELSDLKDEVRQLKQNRLTDEVKSQDNNLIQEDIIVIKGELRKLNHRMIGDEVRRNSLILNSLDENITNIRSKVSETIDLDILGQEGMTGSGMSLGSPSAPPASQEDWHLRNRLLDDVGGLPSAPSYADTAKSGGSEGNGELIVPLKFSPLPLGESSSAVNKDDLKPTSEETQNLPDDVHNKSFTLVQKKKRKNNNIVGSKKPSVDVSLRSAVRMGDLYVGNCDSSATIESLSQYISNEIEINIEKVENIPLRYTNSKAFKVTLNMKDRLKLLSADFWPEGIVCRKYYNSSKSNQ